MSDGCSSGPVVLTLAGPRPFLLVLVLHCPGRVRFFEILAIVPLLSSTILTILFIQYRIIIGYNNVETWVQYSGAEFCHKTMHFK